MGPFDSIPFCCRPQPQSKYKKHTNLVLDHESTDSRSGTFYFV